jgi:hypothetical protein
LVTTVALLLARLESGGVEMAIAPAEVVLLSPSGKQHTTKTKVAVTVAPGARSPPGLEQNVASLQVFETKLN